MNGYKNFETWVTALWLENTESSYARYRDLLTELERERGRDEAISELAKIIKVDVEMNSPLEPVGLYADLLNGALSAIDYYEIAERFADE